MRRIHSGTRPAGQAGEEAGPASSEAGPLRVLILEDQPDDAELLELELRRAGFEPNTIRLESEHGFASSLTEQLDVILSDYSMPQFDALRALSLLQQSGLDIPFIVVTGSFEAGAIECMKRGAADYLLKDRLGRLGPAILQSMRDRILRRERREIEAALRQSEARFRSVAESAIDALVLADEDGVIGYANPAATQTFGYPEEHLLGQHLKVLLAPDAQPGFEPGVEHVGLWAQRGRHTEVVGRKRDGTEFPMDLALSSWEAAGRSFLSVVIRDQTEAKAALKQAQLQDRLAAVGQLAAGIAHDFNNILGTIMLYSELLLRYDGLPDQEERRLRTMVQQARRGANLVSQILDFSRRSVVQRHAMDLVPFMEEMVELLSRTLPETVRSSLSVADERTVVEADPTRLQQVIMNLALNARDAMPDGGELRFTLDRCEFGAEQAPPFAGMPERRWVRLRLTDTGSGISPENLPRVFEPFFSTKAPGDGTGLGLAQVYGLIKQHSGYIDVASEPGAGTTFTIFLPDSQREAGEARAVEAVEDTPGAGETILLVEDNETTREAVGEILKSLKYQVISASSGKHAIEIYERDPGGIDLVLTDLVMPDMGGKALYEALSAKHEGVKVLMMTGYPLGVETKELLDRRKVDWLQKPFSSETVSQKVRELLSRAE